MCTFFLNGFSEQYFYHLRVIYTNKYSKYVDSCLIIYMHATKLCEYFCVCMCEHKDAPLVIWKVVWGPGIPIRPSMA